MTSPPAPAQCAQTNDRSRSRPGEAQPRGARPPQPGDLQGEEERPGSGGEAQGRQGGKSGLPTPPAVSSAVADSLLAKPQKGIRPLSCRMLYRLVPVCPSAATVRSWDLLRIA